MHIGHYFRCTTVFIKFLSGSTPNYATFNGDLQQLTKYNTLQYKKMEQNETKLGKLTEESIKRKERLKALREKATKADKSSASNDEKLPKPVFRSYKPQNETTIGEVLKQEPSGDVEMAVQDQLELLKQPTTIEEIDITNLAPRKPDWDLKRDVAKKLERLERRTQKAIAELILERLKDNQGIENIFEAVNVGTAHTSENRTKNVEED